MTKNRSFIARERAGLGLVAAARYLGINVDDLARAEELDSAFADIDKVKMADVYGVRIEWLTGDVERYDYAHVDTMKGAECLTEHDRSVIAEFAASMPRRKT